MPTPHIAANRDRTVSTVNPLDDPHWDTAISTLPGATFFHGRAWARVLHDAYGFTPLYLTERESASLQSILPLMEANSWLTGRRGISLPFTDECAPLCRNAAVFDRLSRVLSEYANVRKWRYWELRGGRPFIPAAPASLSYWGHTLVLKPDQTALFSRLDSSARRAVRKGEQSGLTVEFSTSLDAIRSFHRLLCQTRRRHGLPPQPFRFFENIQRHILALGQGIVVLARLNQVPVAGAIFFQFGPTALYKFGASDESFQHLRANNLVMWRAIAWLSERGCVSLDFGRTSRVNEGLRRFKLAWGATERSIEYFRHHREIGHFVSSRDDSHGWHNRLFRLMPLPLSRLIGAIAYQHMA